MKSSNQSIKTILVILLGLVGFYIINKSIYILYAALVVGIISLVSQKACNYIHLAWMFFPKILSYIVPNIIMSLIFFLMLTPLSLLQKLVKKNKSVMLSNSSNSTFIITNKKIEQTNFEKPW